MIAKGKAEKPEKKDDKPAPKAKKPPKPAPTTAELRERWVNDIIKAQKEADALGAIHSEADADARLAKKNHQAAVNRLQGLIRRGPSTQLELPLQDAPANGAAAPAVDQAKIEADWNKLLESTPIKDVIPLTQKESEKLIDAGVINVFQFEQLRGGKIKDYPEGLRSLPRVGDATITKWEDAVLNWLKQHQPKPAPKADAKPEEKPADKPEEKKPEKANA